MKKILNKLFKFSFLGAISVCYSPFAMALDSQRGDSEGSGAADGLDKAEVWLKYAMYGASVIGMLGVAFLLFAQHQEAILKQVVRVIVVVCAVSLCFTIPKWFSICIPTSVAEGKPTIPSNITNNGLYKANLAFGQNLQP